MIDIILRKHADSGKRKEDVDHWLEQLIHFIMLISSADETGSADEETELLLHSVKRYVSSKKRKNAARS